MNTAYYKYIALTFICMVIGFLIWTDFFNLSLDRISSASVIFGAHPKQMKNGRNVLMLIFGTLPFLCFISTKISNSNSVQSTIISLILILVFGVCFWQLRIFFLVNQLQHISYLNLPTIDISYELDEFYFELYLGAGMIVGTIISGFAMRKFSRK